jgi:nondiscriminating glutamyl-tRNA synthetase
MTVRVRFAPSPTGHLHIGGVRTALFNFLFARRHGGALILRIEDTDLERNVPGAERELLEGFRWLGLDWDEGPDIGGPRGPYRCTERLPVYRSALAKLQEHGVVYPCFCTPEQLEAERQEALREGRVPRYSGRCRHLSDAERMRRIDAGEAYNWRFAVPSGIDIEIRDLVHGIVRFSSDDIGDFVVFKSNGMPTYNFQVVVDDHEMGITHVIRGEEHLSNTPRQWLIYQVFGWPVPQFAHLPQVLDAQRKKLSKRDPNVRPVQAYRELGYVPHAIVNFLALLGWSPKDDRELLTMDELVERFDLSGVNRSGAVFDPAKLEWMAGQYLRKLPVETLTEWVQEQLARAGWQCPAGVPDDWLVRVVALYQEQMTCAADFLRLARGFFDPGVQWSQDALQVLSDPGAQEVVRAYLERMDEGDWTADASRERFKAIQASLGVRGRALYMPVRAAATGETHGPDLQLTLSLLPREWVKARLQAALAAAGAAGGEAAAGTPADAAGAHGADTEEGV